MDVNQHIEDTYCDDIINKLSDLSLLSQYKRQKSVIKKINKHKIIFANNNVNEECINAILSDQEYILDLVPAGTKGVIRGLEFNKQVKSIITTTFDKHIKLVIKPYLDIQFEKNTNMCVMSEIPDFYIHNKTNNHLIIGFNQVDLLGGGAQINRASKYILSNNELKKSAIIDKKKIKILCVVANKVSFSKKPNKAYNIYKTGFEQKILCYPKEIIPIITSFLKLPKKCLVG